MKLNSIAVVRWISWGAAQGLVRCSLPDLGGNSAGWRAVAENLDAKDMLYVEGIREAGRRISGMEHQELPDGVPVFADGTTFTASCRAWGDIMAVCWSQIDGKDYDYCEFAWRPL